MIARSRLIFCAIAITFEISACSITYPADVQSPNWRSGTLSIQAIKAAEDVARRTKDIGKTLDLPKQAWQEVVSFAAGPGQPPGESLPSPASGPIAVTDSGRTGPPTTTSSSMASGRLAIADVVEESSGLSVAGADAPAMLTPSLDGSPIRLRVKGHGFFRKRDERDQDEDCDIDGDDWEINAFTRYNPLWVADFITHTYLTDKRAHRVLIDESIALNPAAGGAFGDSELTMLLDPRGIPDYQVGGLHGLTVVIGKNWVQVPVRFGRSTPPRPLAPQILSSRLLRTGDESEKWLVEIVGRNLPISYLNTYASINGKRAYAHGTFATAGDSIGFVHLPKNALAATGPNQLVVATPFGITFGQF
jgi:hypothetical protein